MRTAVNHRESDLLSKAGADVVLIVDARCLNTMLPSEFVSGTMLLRTDA